MKKSSVRTSGMYGRAGVLKLFESMADWVWTLLGEARRLRLSLSEDTISDLTMLEIARYPTSLIEVKKVSKQKERFVGFDWMWVIRGSAMNFGVYVVQAKKIRIDQSDGYLYGKLKYQAGTKYQIDALEDFADWIGAKPLYCFFNHVDDNTAQEYWNCRQVPPKVSQMGCTLAPLEAVRPVHDTPKLPKNFASIHRDPRALPWRCLFHPQCQGFGQPEIAKDQHANLFPGIGRFEAFLGSIFGVEHAFVDIDTVIQRLDLDELVNRYATGRFLPIPERISIIKLED